MICLLTMACEQRPLKIQETKITSDQKANFEVQQPTVASPVSSIESDEAECSAACSMPKNWCDKESCDRCAGE